MDATSPRRGGWRVAGLAAALVALAVLGAALRADRWLLGLTTGLRDAGAAGMLAFVGLYIAATVLALPGLILTMAAGWLYGPFLGTALVSPASVLGATGAFLLGRTVARGWVAARLGANPRLAAIDAAVARRPFVLVLLLRLSPVFPFNALNYGLGLTAVPLRAYVLGSWIGMLPGTVLYVGVGAAAGSAAAIAAGEMAVPTAGRAALWGIGLLVTVASVVLVTRLARRELQRAVPDAAERPDPRMALRAAAATP